MTGKKKGDIMELSRNHISPERNNMNPLYVNCTTGELSCQDDIELADGKRNWKERKKMSINVAKLMRSYDKDRADKIKQCGTYLVFVRTPDDKQSLRHANFCRERLCPICQWRRSIKLGVQADKIYRNLTEQGYKHIFVTLTVRNCIDSDLNGTVDDLVAAAQRWQKLTIYRNAIIGSYRALEITYNAKDNTYHPHLHYLLTVPADYFAPDNPNYIDKDKLIASWRAAARLDYDPSVSIEGLRQKPGQSITSACAEMCKYPVKSAEIKSAHVLEAIDMALRGRRLVQWGGKAAEIRRELNMDDIEHGNMVHTDDNDVTDVPLEQIVYVWRYGLYIPLDYKMLEVDA